MQYEPALAAAGIAVDYSPLLDNHYLQRRFHGRPVLPWSLAGAGLRRLASIVRARHYDAVWLHCEYLPFAPGGFEALALRIGNTPVVFDYDDAIFHMYDSSPNPIVRRLLGHKLEPLLKRAAACLCGNEYLRRYASQFNANALVLPTVVDTGVYAPAEMRQESQPPIIGWIGSPSTWPYVRPLLPVLRELCASGKASFLVIGAGPDAAADRFPGMELRDWNEAREVEDVQAMDIGIMPLPDQPWARGKSGYKLVQYMACGVPVVASPVGANSTIVDHGQNGLLSGSASEWRGALGNLLNDPELRARMGAAGRDKVAAEYSLQSQAPRLIEVMRSVLQS